MAERLGRSLQNFVGGFDSRVGLAGACQVSTGMDEKIDQSVRVERKDAQNNKCNFSIRQQDGCQLLHRRSSGLRDGGRLPWNRKSVVAEQLNICSTGRGTQMTV